jgi:flagellar hook-associated protein 2
MGQITSGIGLVSGINTTSIINQLIQLDSAPVTQLQNRISTATSQKGAYTDLQTKLNSLKTVGTTLTNINTFQAATATSSDDKVLTATAANGAATGTFQLQVAQLVSSQQAVTGGFSDPNQTKIGAGTITISQGGGELTTQTALSVLNGGGGVQRGVFRITDRSGKSAAIDISSAITLDDVVKKINTSLDISVRASIGKNGLVLEDLTGQPDPPIGGQPVPPNLIVKDLGSGHTAADLGILGSVASNTLTGTSVNTIGRSTALAQINDGRGIHTATTGADFTVHASDGSTFDVTLATAKTIGQVIDAINTATAGKVVAGVSVDGSGLRLTDAVGGAVSVTALTDSKAAADLGIDGPGATGTLTGRSLIASLGSTLISSLHGGTGIPLGSIGLVDRSGGTATVDLSSASSVQDILDSINKAGIGVKASLNASGNGIQVADTTTGTGQLKIFDVSSTTADALGIKGIFDLTTPTASGANLHRQFLSANTSLSDYNGGKGVAPGKFRITASNGAQSEIDLTTGNYVTVGDVLKTINSRNLGVTASINTNGNGILLTDTAGGAAKLKIENTSGTSANDLNILGTATGTTIDGSFEKTIAVDANDTLASVQTKINTLGFGVTASVINDGSGATPYRLSLNATSTGRDGRFVFDAGSTGLAAHNLVDAQNAAVFVGGQNAAQPLLITSSSNQITNVIKGVTIDLHNTSAAPVTLSVTKDPTSISAQLKSFTDGFNSVVTTLTTLTSFDSTTKKPGLLLGDSAAQTIQNDLFILYNSVVQNAGRYKILADVGITVGDKGQLSFDSIKFGSAFGTDPTAVQKLFTQSSTGLGTLITNKVNKLTDPATGLIPIETKAIDDKNKSFQDRIAQLNDQLSAKRTRLTKQFANMESVLAGLQSQQAALGSLGTLGALNSTSSKSTSSSSASSGSATGA